MLLKFLGTLVLAAGLLLVTGDNDGRVSKQDGEVKVQLKDVKCFLMPKKDVKESNAVEYLAGKVYFCCGNCVKKFSADKEKFATKANHHLALTSQYVQTGCPISGGEVDAEQTSEIGGVKVAFCCGNCKGKVDEAEGLEAKAELVFSKDAFEKSYAAKKKEDDKSGK